MGSSNTRWRASRTSSRWLGSLGRSGGSEVIGARRRRRASCLLKQESSRFVVTCEAMEKKTCETGVRLSEAQRVSGNFDYMVNCDHFDNDGGPVMILEECDEVTVRRFCDFIKFGNYLDPAEEERSWEASAGSMYALAWDIRTNNAHSKLYQEALRHPRMNRGTEWSRPIRGPSSLLESWYKSRNELRPWDLIYTDMTGLWCSHGSDESHVEPPHETFSRPSSSNCHRGVWGLLEHNQADAVAAGQSTKACLHPLHQGPRGHVFPSDGFTVCVVERAAQAPAKDVRAMLLYCDVAERHPGTATAFDILRALDLQPEARLLEDVLAGTLSDEGRDTYKRARQLSDYLMQSCYITRALSMVNRGIGAAKTYQEHCKRVHIGTRCIWSQCNQSLRTKAEFSAHLLEHNEADAIAAGQKSDVSLTTHDAEFRESRWVTTAMSPPNLEDGAIKAYVAAPDIPYHIEDRAEEIFGPGAVVQLAFTPTFPLEPELKSAMEDGCTRCIGIKNCPTGLTGRLLEKLSFWFANDLLTPEHLNTAVWITNLPPTCTHKQLLDSVRGFGKIFATVINPPAVTTTGATHFSDAAKLVVF
ncbi:hypothetical protein F4778DRAFT_779113 [Xylariomycetidae sp. FL2044]|nr:hypothetical protein F4778DRAFT_779113 [Xylariomycetidae sp. FL2044]